MTNFNRVEIIKQDNLKNRVETRIQTRIEKIKKIISIQTSERLRANQKNKNQKKFFSIAAPTMNLRKEGRVPRVKNVGGIYSEGKCAVLAICVRTQNDFYLECGISVHPNNKTRLKRFICVHIGRYTRKQDGTRLKMNKYT